MALAIGSNIEFNSAENVLIFYQSVIVRKNSVFLGAEPRARINNICDTDRYVTYRY